MKITSSVKNMNLNRLEVCDLIFKRGKFRYFVEASYSPKDGEVILGPTTRMLKIASKHLNKLGDDFYTSTYGNRGTIGNMFADVEVDVSGDLTVGTLFVKAVKQSPRFELFLYKIKARLTNLGRGMTTPEAYVIPEPLAAFDPHRLNLELGASGMLNGNNVTYAPQAGVNK